VNEEAPVPNDVAVETCEGPATCPTATPGGSSAANRTGVFTRESGEAISAWGLSRSSCQTEGAWGSLGSTCLAEGAGGGWPSEGQAFG
jgi:hypothetical protein